MNYKHCRAKPLDYNSYLHRVQHGSEYDEWFAIGEYMDPKFPFMFMTSEYHIQGTQKHEDDREIFTGMLQMAGCLDSTLL